METIPFTFDSFKDIPNTELSSYFRSEAVKFESKENVSDNQILSIFRESLNFYIRNLDNFLLNDLVYLIQRCWHKNPEILWEHNSDQIIKISKENFNGMIIVASISAFTSDMQETTINLKSKAFFENFIHESFNEIDENYENIENNDCDSFPVFNRNLDRKQFFYLLFELIQAIPYSDAYISKYLPYIINGMPPTSIYTLFSFYVTNNLIQILPRNIFCDRNFIKFISPSNSLILLNNTNEEEFLTTFPWYYQKILENESNNSELSYSFLTHVSRTDSEQIFNFMNKSCMEGKSRIQQIIDFASDCEFSKDVLLNLRRYKFHLPDIVSKKIKSLDDENEFLAIISSNPLLYMDRFLLDPILLESENPLVYNNLFRTCDISDYIFKDLQFWSHAVPLFPKINDLSVNSLFIQVDSTNASVRVSRLLLHNFPQNMKPEFFDFARCILEQDRDFESFLHADETLVLLSQIDNYQPFQFWKLFISINPIISVINHDYENHLALSLGVACLSIYQYEIHSSPPDLRILVFKILEQDADSISELHSICQNKPDWKTDYSNLSKPALSVVTAANLLSSVILNKFMEFKVEGLTDDIFLPFITIIINNLSFANRDAENNFYRFNQIQRELPLNNFLAKSDYSKQLITYLNSINFENQNNDFIEILLNTFIKLSDSITVSCCEILLKILKIFSENLDFYLDVNSPNAKLMSQFFGRIFRDLSIHGQNTKKFRQAITLQMQPYIIRLLIAFPCKYSSNLLDSQTIKRVVKEEKDKNKYNSNIILFITNDSSTKDKRKKTISFKLDEITQMVKDTIEKQDFGTLRAIINFEKDLYTSSFIPLLNEKIPIDIKFLVLNKLIPFETHNYNNTLTILKARESISFEMLISIIKDTKNLKIFKDKLFPMCFYFLLESPIMVNYFIVLFEKHYDFSPFMNGIKYNGKLNFSEFSTAFKKFFQVMKNDKKSFIVKKPFSPELEQPTEFALQFVNMLIDDFINQPTWQVLTTLFFITSNLPFLLLYIDRIEIIFEKLFELFTIFEKYQEIPPSHKQAYMKKHKSTINFNSNNFRSIRNQFLGFPGPFPSENDEEFNNNNNNGNENMQSDSDVEIDENDLEIKNMRILFSAAYSGIYFLGSLVSIPQIADKFFHWSLSNFSTFTNGQVASFLSILVPVINRETSQHVAVSYLIRYDWISLFTNFYEKIERPINKLTRYVLANLLEVTYNYFIVYIRSLTAESASTLDELTQFDNPFEISYDYKIQVSPNFNPWFSSKKYEFKTNLVRNMLGISNHNPDHQNMIQFFPNHFFGNRPIVNYNRPNRSTNFPIGRPNSLLSSADVTPTPTPPPNENENENGESERPNTFNDPPPRRPLLEATVERREVQHALVPPRPPPFLTNGILHQAFSRMSRDALHTRPINRSIHDLLMNSFRQGFDTLNRERDDDPLNQHSFWSIFHLTDDETAFLRSMNRISGQIKIEYPTETTPIANQIKQLMNDQAEPVDLSLFSNINNEFAFNQLDPITQAALLRNELKVPKKVTAKMRRYLITQPQWMTVFLSQHENILLTPHHYVALKAVLDKLKEMEEEEDEESEAKSTKEFFENFKSNIRSKSQKMIDAFLSPKFTLFFSPSPLPSSPFLFQLNNPGMKKKKSLIYRNIIMRSLTGILQELAADDDETLKSILDKIDAGIKELNPMHIHQLLQILVSLSDLYKVHPKRYFSMSLFKQMVRIVGSPEVRSQSAIIETAARLMVDLTESFYRSTETENQSIFSEIEASTLQIFSILLNSPNIQTVNKAMKLISSLRNDLREDSITSFANQIILSRFNLIYEKFNKQKENDNDNNDDDEIKSLAFSDSISSFLIIFISRFPELATKVKEELLIILERILQLKDKNVHLISQLINCLCPKRTKQIPIKQDSTTTENKTKNNENENENANANADVEDEIEDDENQNDNIKFNGKPIPIPIVYYNKSPKFWQIIFKNLSWFQDYITSHPNAIDRSFSFLKDYMELLTFKQKCTYFRKYLFQSKINKTKFELKINRHDILKDSFYKLRSSTDKSRKNILSNFHVKFENEPGFDMGGLTRDWFTSLIKELFNENYCLFKLSENKRSYQPNPSSYINENHLDYFEFTGLIIARAIIGGICVDAHLSPSFIKQILGVEVTLRDLQDVDKVLYSSLMWLLENDIDGTDLDIRFTSGFRDIDMQKTVDLKENGENMIVTDKNKKEYVKLYCQHIMKGQIKEQTEAFLKGFYSLISQEEISVFTPTELDLLICGVPEIDVEDLKRNCDFSSPYSRNHPAVTMFFDVISKWGHEDLAKLLLFITGSSQVPVGGFKMMKESSQPIIIAPGGEDPRLPQAHTCMNTLDLPKYNDKNVLEEKLLLSISECKNFGFN